MVFKVNLLLIHSQFNIITLITNTDATGDALKSTLKGESRRHSKMADYTVIQNGGQRYLFPLEKLAIRKSRLIQTDNA
jgi:hypothetical protein